jgi:DNA repair protein RadC
MKSTTVIEKCPALAEIEVSYKSKIKSSQLKKITCSQDVYEVLKSIWSMDKIEYVEEFIILCLNRANKVLGWVKISQGGIAGTVCDPKVIFQAALKANASAIILSHNHPSGNTSPSQADKEITRKLVEIGKIHELPVLDHLIVTSESYLSMADESLM